MEGLGAAANIIAVIDLSAKVASLCLRYSKEVAGARADIERLQSHISHLSTVLQAAKRLTDGPGAESFDTSQELIQSFRECAIELRKLENRLAPSASRTVMRRFGLRALKWPFTSKEVNQAIDNLDRYGKAISLGLQIDQAAILVDIQDKIKNLKLEQADDALGAKTARFVVPFPPDPDFVHRPVIWTWITGQFKSAAHQRLALVGMGGFGKSQLAIQYAHQVRAEDSDTSIFWVHGRTRATFEESYRALADVLLLPRRHDPDVDVLALVRDWLMGEKDMSPWLMIVDNADDPNTFFPENDGDDASLAVYLPNTTRGKIIFTSRSLDVAEKLTGSSKAVLRIPTMDDEQALQLLRNKLNDMDEGAALDLIQTLDCIPLAVNQAAAYINRRSPRVTTRSYVNEFRGSEKRKDSLLRSDKGDLRRQADVSNSVVVTWQITFEQIRREHPRAAKLLSLMSCFQPQNIPEKMLHDYDEDEGSARDGRAQEDFEDDMDVLQGYSLVAFTDTGLCEMHSLVQFCTRVWISEFGDPKRWKSLFIKLAAENFPSGHLEEWEECQRLLPHVQPLLADDSTDEVDQLRRAALATNMARYMMTVGDGRRSLELAEDAFEVRKTILGDDHRFTLTSMSALAASLMLMGRWKDAEIVATRAVETRKARFGDEESETLISMNTLGDIYRGQGRYEEAASLHRKAAEVFHRKFGPDNADTLITTDLLAATLSRQGKWEEAEQLFKNVLERSKATLGPDAPDTLITMDNLAETYMNQGRFKEAEPLQLQAMEAFRRRYGPDNPNTLTSMGNLAGTYRSLGRLKEAEELEIQGLEIRRARLGDDNIETAFNKNNLAETYRYGGRWDEAETLQLQANEVFRSQLGDDHPDTRTGMTNLAFIWYGAGRHQDAIAQLQKVLELSEAGSARDHPKTKAMATALKTWRETHPVDV